MIKKTLLTMLATLILFANVGAETSAVGIVQHVSLEQSIIEINDVEYRVDMDRTVLISGMHSLDLALLEEGSLVSFVIEKGILIEIKLVEPYDFNS